MRNSSGRHHSFAATGAFGANNAAEAVRAATHQVAGGRTHRSTAFSFTQASSTERFIAPFLGLYLGYAVARVPEVFPAVFVPRLLMALMIIFVVLLASIISPEGWKQTWYASLPLRCVVLLVGVATVTVPLGIYISGSLNYLVTRYSIPVVVFLACLIFLRDRRNFRVAVTIYVLCVLAVAVHVLLTYDPNLQIITDSGQILTGPDAIQFHRLSVGESLDPNDWGAVVATSLPLALWLGWGGFIRRIFWSITALILIAAVIPTQSRGALLGLVAVAFTLAAVGATGWRKVFVIGLIAIGGLLFAGMATQGQLDRFLSFSTDDYNLTGEGRWFFWRQGFVWMLKRPWGYGIGNFGTYFGWMNGPERAAHSVWVQYGMELGVTGLALFVILCYTVWRQNLKNRAFAVKARQVAGKLASSEAALNGHMVAVLAGCFATGSFLSNAYYPLTYMALGLAAAALLGNPLRGLAEQQALSAEATPQSPPPGRIARRRR